MSNERGERADNADGADWVWVKAGCPRWVRWVPLGRKAGCPPLGSPLGSAKESDYNALHSQTIELMDNYRDLIQNAADSDHHLR